MHTEEHIEIEARGSREGINPMFGEWEQEFNIEPVSYSSQRVTKDKFRASVLAFLEPQFVFYGEVKVEIKLYLNEQKAEENPKYGDLDNYAKQILDSIKGSEGVVIDDCQVQSLGISWIDIPGDSYFHVRIKGRPDEFLQKPLKLYEMPDKRYYPLSQRGWTQQGIVDASPDSFLVLLNSLSESTAMVKKLKHEFRTAGFNSLDAYRETKLLMPCLLGFHKSSVVDSGFELVGLKSWKS